MSRCAPGALSALAFIVLATGCAGVREAGPGDDAGRVEMSPAAETLLSTARRQQAAGDLSQASGTLERAIRIEPHQAALWLELAGIRFTEGDVAQAEQLARRARSFTTPGDPLTASIDDLISRARDRLR